MTRTSGPQAWLRITVVMFVSAALLAGTGHAQNSKSPAGMIRGRVQDSVGFPLVGALVAVQSADVAFRERWVFTDHVGAFSIPDLVAGKYFLKVTRSNFLPSATRDIDLDIGADLALTVNLQTALDIVRRGIRRVSLEDMKWVLRSAPSTRPILRLTQDDGAIAEENGAAARSERSGYFQLYSTSHETSGPSSDTVGSQFAFNVPLAGDSQVTFTGQYTEAADQPRGIGATYEFSSADRHQSSLAINLRQGALINGEVEGSEAREISIEYGERLQWSEHLLLDYSAVVGRADGMDEHSYLRPEFGVTWVPRVRTMFRASLSRQSPEDAMDPIRGLAYFDRAVYLPPDLERYSHMEVGATHTLSENVQVSAVAFRDELGTQALLVDANDGRRAIMIFDASNAPTTGVRLAADRSFRDFEAGLAYTYANAVGFDEDVVSPDDLRQQARNKSFHLVTARIKTKIDLTQTAVTAVYRWSSGFSLGPVDPYQRFAEYNDPTLSLTIAQDLPSLKILPGKLQAIVDARNLFDPSFGSRRTVYAGYPRLLKGGIHIKF